MYLSANNPVNLNGLELSLGTICLRLLCAMLVGLVIGTEREYINRPAGMRTHILVALGSCVAMLTGQMIFVQYLPYGDAPDPARLAAQVITGVGFLGAGTILREGAMVKGLTTAASLWAVACLGVAAGGGYYSVALLGMVFVFVTLTILEVFQHKLMNANGHSQSYCLMTSDVSEALRALNAEALAQRANVNRMEVEQQPDSCRILFRAEFGGIKSKLRQEKFLAQLAQCRYILSVKILEENEQTR